MESLDEVNINYVAQPLCQGTVMTVTPGTAYSDVVANVNP
jgi:hypothetical protein